MAPVSIVNSMNTNNTGPNSDKDPSTQDPQDTGEHEGPPPPDAEEASGGVADSSEPVVDLPDQGNVELQDAMQKLVESAQYLFSYIMEKRAQHACGDCDSGEEPANIAYGAAFYDENGQGCGSMGEYFTPTGRVPMYEDLGPLRARFGERSADKQRNAAQHGFSIGLSLGSAITAAGVNALGQDVLWLLGGVAEKMGGGLRNAFGRRSNLANIMRMVPRPPTSGDLDVTRMPTQEPWGSFCRAAAPETPGPAVATPGPAPEDEFMKKVMDLKEQVEAGTEKHEDVADIFKHFEEIFGDVFGKKL